MFVGKRPDPISGGGRWIAQMILTSALGSLGLVTEADAQQTQAGRTRCAWLMPSAVAATTAKRDAAGFAAHIRRRPSHRGQRHAKCARGRQAVVEAWKQYFDGPTAPFSWSRISSRCSTPERWR